MLKVALKNVKEILLCLLPEPNPLTVSLVLLLLPGLFKLAKVFEDQQDFVVMIGKFVLDMIKL